MSYSFPSSVFHHIARIAQAQPEQVAVVDGPTTLTYAALVDDAQRLSVRLIAAGAGPEQRVGIGVARSAAAVIAILAADCAGCAFVPLDLEAPAQRLAYQLDDSAVSIVIAAEGARTRLGDFTGTVVPVVVPGALATASVFAPDRHPRSLAYVLYTSGSTGRPKGVLIECRDFAQHCRDIASHHGYGPEDRVLQFAALAFDAALEQIFAPLVAGATVVLRDDDVWAPTAFHARLRQHAITVVDLPPAYLHQLVQSWAATPDTRPGAPLRLVIVGGERLQPETVRLWQQAGLGAVRLVNAYGPTEATITAIAGEVTDAVSDTIPIGGPLPGRAAYLLDARGAPVPDGVVGELYLGGLGIARGYHGRPDLTAERFLPDPFATDTPGARMYRTGDLARRRPDGAIEFLGRRDRQVKLRGQRIELDEIEAVLASQPGVAECSVSLHTDAAAGQRLVGYVVNAGHAPSMAALRRSLAEALPPYMIPSALIELAALPRSSSGKVDPTRLPEPDFDDEARPYVAPRNAIEARLAALWRDLLGLTRVGVTDSFFELGGHSLLAVELVTRIEHGFGVALAPSRLWAAPTIARLADQITPDVDRAAQPSTLLPRAGHRVASFGQERLWLLDRWQPETALYNLPLLFRVGRMPAREPLRRALCDLVERHIALRTAFRADAERPEPTGEAAVDVDFTVHDLRALPQTARPEAARDLWRRLAHRPFDLARGPLVRIDLAQIDDDAGELLLNVHHIAFDGWSLGLFLAELAERYAAHLGGTAAQVPEPEVTYTDYASWEREQASSTTWAEHRAFWKRYLNGVPQLLELPTDRPRPARQTFRGSRRSLRLPRALITHLERLTTTERTTTFAGLLAAFQILIGRATGQTDFVVGIPVSNRQHPATRDLIGFFVNTLPWRADLTGAPTFREIVARVHHAATQILAHQELPLESILETIGLERGTGRNPLIQALFVLQDAPTSIAQPDGLSLDFIEELDTGCAKFDLTFTLEALATDPHVVVEYNTDLFVAPTIDRWLARFAAVLAGALQAPDEPIESLDTLTDDDRAVLDHTWQGPDLAFEPHATLSGLFEAQAERTPDAVALRFDHQALTYADLLERVDRIARRLCAHGAGPGSLVGVCLPRDVDLVASLLAVLKTGAAYVPLDPAYPAERLAFMLHDSGCSLALSTAALRGRLPHADLRVLTLDDADDCEPAATLPAIDPTGLAYVIYTSGSTGRPKGVMLTQRNAVAFLAWATTCFSPADLGGVLAATSICFDLSIFEIFLPLAVGGTVVLVENALHLPTCPQHDAVTLVNTVPSAMTELIAMGGVPAGVRVVNLAGEPLKRDLAQRVYALPHVQRVYNLYGPSEDTTYSTFVCVPRTEIGEPTIGRPIANTQAYILDSDLRRVPPGSVGELYLAGDGVARGYWRRPDLTAERFLPNPFDARGGRMYRTGDRARHRWDGEIEFLGRRDHQVKLRGFRIELSEVEATLHRHPAVANAVVVVHDDFAGGPALVAYVERDAAHAGVDGLRPFLREHLPEYMVPTLWVDLERLPLTPNGKVDRARLPAPDGGRRTSVGPRAPATPIEQVVADLYAEVLGLPTIGADDDFFDQGGQSLLATQVATRLERLFRIKVPLRVVFEASTPARLAQHVTVLETVAGQSERLAQLHLKLKAMTPEARQALLARSAAAP